MAGVAPRPWPPPSPARSRGAVAAEHDIAVDLAARRAHLVAAPRRAAGVRVAAAPASSFVLIEVAGGERVRLALRARGFAVRRGDTFPGLGADWFLRIAVRETATTDAFCRALAEHLARRSPDDAVAAVGADPGPRSAPLDEAAMADARALQARLTKPPGSLGVLEELSVRLAGLAGRCPPPLPGPAAVAVFAGDHGVHAQGSPRGRRRSPPRWWPTSWPAARW